MNLKDITIYQILGWVFLALVFAAIVSGVYYLQMKNLPIDSAIVHQDPTADWKTYTNRELGFEFKYPPASHLNASPEYQNNEIDQGKNRAVWIRSKADDVYSPVIFQLYAYSSDYVPGAGEGCCYIYADKPIDLSLTDTQIANVLKRELYYNNDPRVYELKRTELHNRDVLRFFRMNYYTEGWLSDTILIPFDRSGFSNILITGPDLAKFEISGDSREESDIKFDQAHRDAAEIVKSKNFTQNVDYNLFNQILSTLKFTEPEVCIQVIQRARNKTTGEIKDFPTPCDVPEGWEKISPEEVK